MFTFWCLGTRYGKDNHEKFLQKHCFCGIYFEERFWKNDHKYWKDFLFVLSALPTFRLFPFSKDQLKLLFIWFKVFRIPTRIKSTLGQILNNVHHS
jgi:hypothetical protein